LKKSNLKPVVNKIAEVRIGRVSFVRVSRALEEEE